MTTGFSKRVGVAADHGGFGLKQELVARLRTAGYEVVDFGAHALNPEDDYPDFGIPMALAPLSYTIWNRVMRFDPQDPIRPNRDRFVLSNGHALDAALFRALPQRG